MASKHALDVQLDFEDEAPLQEAAYYVRLRQTDGEYAWSTPIWVACNVGSQDAGQRPTGLEPP